MTPEMRERCIEAIRECLYGRSLADATLALDALLKVPGLTLIEGGTVEYGQRNAMSASPYGVSVVRRPGHNLRRECGPWGPISDEASE